FESTRAPPGARTTETYRPLPGGENQARPRRPRPEVCSSAVTTVPSESGRAASASATSLVEPIVGANRIVDPMRFSRGRTRSSASAKSGGRSERLELKADVDGRRGMCECADRNEVGASRRKVAETFERHAAGDLDPGAATDPANRFANGLDGQIVEQ